MVELKRMEQEGKMMEEFVQEFKRAVRESRYKWRPLANLHEILAEKISTMSFSTTSGSRKISNKY